MTERNGEVFPRATIAAAVRNLREYLTGLGLTRGQIATCLNVSRRALYGWETGTMRPTPEHLRTLRALGSKADEMEAVEPGMARVLLTSPEEITKRCPNGYGEVGECHDGARATDRDRYS